MKSAFISIHALRGEGDAIFRPIFRAAIAFQSTPSVGRATLAQSLAVVAYAEFQSTPSVGRATNYASFTALPKMISIHALRGEGDAFSTAG